MDTLIALTYLLTYLPRVGLPSLTVFLLPPVEIFTRRSPQSHRVRSIGHQGQCPSFQQNRILPRGSVRVRSTGYSASFQIFFMGVISGVDMSMALPCDVLFLCVKCLRSHFCRFGLQYITLFTINGRKNKV